MIPVKTSKLSPFSFFRAKGRTQTADPPRAGAAPAQAADCTPRPLRGTRIPNGALGPGADPLSFRETR